MWRDRWLALGTLGAVVSCLACLTPAAVIALDAIGLDAWTGHLDAVLLSVRAGFAGLVASRYSIGQRRTP